MKKLYIALMTMSFMAYAQEEVEYKLNSLTNTEDRTPNKLEVIKTTLREYNNLMADIQLWESIINGIEEQNTEKTQKENV